jgi:enolase-phosphatase E1
MIILMDVEGTTTSIHFVHQELFPYSFEAIGNLDQLKNEDESLAPLWKEAKEVCSTQSQRTLDDADIIDILRKWIKEDRKEPVLKSIQGLLWERGYKSGELKGHVYPDVPQAFERWKKSGLDLAIYSSGSVLAQKLLFSHTEYGDLTPFLGNHFDTSVGHKREPGSYEVISRELKVRPDEVFFLTDIKEELEAALAAGMKGCLLNREGALSLVEAYPCVTSFHDIDRLLTNS